MRKTAYLLTLTVVLIIALASTMVIATISPPATPEANSFLVITSQTAIRGAPATSLLQGATTTLVQTFPMVLSTIQRTHYVITDAKLTFGLSPPALLWGTDMATASTLSDYNYSATLAGEHLETRIGAANSMNVVGAILAASRQTTRTGAVLPEIVAGVSFTF